MKGRWLFWIIAANLLVLVGLAFAYPHLMVSPGPVVAAHAEVGTDCFACHKPWRGAAATLCIECHALPDIGLRTTKGAAIVPSSTQPRLKTSFHQELIEQDCMACHTDHRSPRLAQQSRKSFSHALLRPAVQKQCESCHQKPTDRLHQKVAGDCQACHRQDAWKPATFDHAKSFVLDRDHNAECVTCHKGNDYSAFTCYGCHEHTPANIRAEHEKEGIRDFENCVECHRDPGVEPEKSGRKGEGGGRKKGTELCGTPCVIGHWPPYARRPLSCKHASSRSNLPTSHSMGAIGSSRAGRPHSGRSRAPASMGTRLSSPLRGPR